MRMICVLVLLVGVRPLHMNAQQGSYRVTLVDGTVLIVSRSRAAALKGLIL
jgi:hypothetical protein